MVVVVPPVAGHSLCQVCVRVCLCLCLVAHVLFRSGIVLRADDVKAAMGGPVPLWKQLLSA